MSPDRTVRAVRLPVGIHVGAGAVAAVVAVAVAAGLPASTGLWRLLPVAVAMLAFGAITVDPVAAGLVAVLAYLLVTGFLVDQFGVLAWHGSSDMYRLVIIVVSTGVGLALGEWSTATRPSLVKEELPRG